MLTLKLTERKPLFNDVITFIFEPDEPLSWQPGQYMHYYFEHPEADERGIERWFTISAAPYENHVTITTRFNDRKSSSFKKALKEMPVGGTIKAEGPGGKFVIADTSKKTDLDCRRHRYNALPVNAAADGSRQAGYQRRTAVRQP